MAHAKKAAVEESNNIRVVCRFRPEKVKDGIKYDPRSAKAVRESKESSCETFEIDEENSCVSVLDTFEKRSFTFDKMIGFKGTQSEVFADVRSTVESILKGCNGTILAYGQTSSVSTYSIYDCIFF